MYKVKIIKNRPDCRMFQDLLFNKHKNHENIDGDGDSFHIYSKSWTELYLIDRLEPHYFIDIYPNDNDSSYFEIHSNNSNFAELCSIYLYEYCGNSIEKDNKKLSLNEIITLQNKFFTKLEEARTSIWHKSNENNPYPQPVLGEKYLARR